MRLPNGYGTIYKLGGKRRRPWIARRPVGKIRDDNKKIVRVQYETIGYYATRKDALEALALIANEPIRKNNPLTLEEIYTRWSAQKFPKLKRSAHYERAFALLSPLHDRAFEEITLVDAQAVFNASGKNRPVLSQVKVMLSQLNEFAIVNEFIPDRRNIFSRLETGENPRKLVRTIFTPDQIHYLWANHEKEWQAVTLILIYTGLRNGELLSLRKGDIEGGVIHVRESKTAAGVRDVPVADCIAPIMNEYTEKAKNYIFTIPYKTLLNHTLGELGHRPHDTRHTFTTLLTEKGVDQRIIESIIGHHVQNLAFDVYTHISIEQKREAVNLLDIC